MAWIDKLIESVASGLGNLVGQGLSSAGEKMGASLPAGRPMDRRSTARRMSKEQAEAFNLYKRLRPHEDQASQIVTDFCRGVVIEALNPTPDELTSPVVQAADSLCQNLLAYEGYYPLPEIDFTRQLSLGEIWDATKLLERCLLFYETQKRQREIAEVLQEFVKALLAEGAVRLPATGETGEEWAQAELLNLHLSPARSIDQILRATIRTPEDDGRFSRLGETLMRSFLLASGIDPQWKSDKQPKWASELTDKTPEEIIALYVGQTPFYTFFTTRFPFAIPLQFRFEHTHIVGGSGHGKTQLLQNRILKDLALVSEGQASVVVIDSQGDMFRKIQQLQVVGEMPERVVLIDPNEIDTPPALNLFDFGLERVSTYDALTQEMLLNGAISLYEYIFGALLGAELTARQGVIFSYLARLLMVVPGATIDTLIDFLEEPEAVTPYLPKIADDPMTSRFFERQFFSKAFNDTRAQILYRIFDVLKTRALARMFRNKHNKLNLFDAMQRGSLILINTAKDLLKQEGTEILGRFFIALICQAAQERASIPEEKRTPTFVYIDEAHDYFDESMENLLNQARKYRVGLVLAHQNLDQFEEKLRATVMASTAIKMVGGLSAKDAHTLSADMRCEPELLLSMRKYDREKKTEFACFVRNLTQRPIPLTVTLGTMEEAPRLSKQAQI